MSVKKTFPTQLRSKHQTISDQPNQPAHQLQSPDPDSIAATSTQPGHLPANQKPQKHGLIEVKNKEADGPAKSGMMKCAKSGMMECTKYDEI